MTMTLKNKKLALAIVVGFAALAVFVQAYKRSVKPAGEQNNAAVKTNNELVYTAENKLQEQYVIEYLRGYNACLQQNGKQPIQVKVRRYTKNTDATHTTPVDDAAWQETMQEGYTRGYHDATDSLVCPRYKM